MGLAENIITPTARITAVTMMVISSTIPGPSRGWRR
jgi:hypothetical protein